MRSPRIRELRNIIMALSLHPWNNTPEEAQRLRDAKEELRHLTRLRHVNRSGSRSLAHA